MLTNDVHTYFGGLIMFNNYDNIKGFGDGDGMPNNKDILNKLHERNKDHVFLTHVDVFSLHYWDALFFFFFLCNWCQLQAQNGTACILLS